VPAVLRSVGSALWAASNSPSQHRLSLRHSVQGTVYVLHFDPPTGNAGHYIGWTEDDVCDRIAVHLQGRGSPLVRAAVAAGVDVRLSATYEGTRYLEQRLKRWHNTSRFCALCRERRDQQAS
jgi:predicted GIY-YIG superfamily endonuclease